MSELEQAAHRLAKEKEASEKFTRARSRLVMCKPAQKGADMAATVFFATLALRLKSQPDWNVKTACVDGETLSYNPDFLSGLPDDEALGVVCHEVMHCALGHHGRQGAREAKLWNTACDLAVNQVIEEARIKLPSGALFAGRGAFAQMPKWLSAEEYYRLLQEEEGEKDKDGDEEAEGQGGGAGGPPDPGGTGAVAPPSGGQARENQLVNEWQAAVSQAAEAARQKGRMPGGLARFVGEVLNPTVPWQEVLREFVSKRARSDFSWRVPNRRLLHRGLYLPGLLSEELGRVVVAVDTSGSISERELSAFASEMEGILQSFQGAELTIVYHDAQVQHVQRWQAQDGPLVLEPRGGGGTSHVPFFEWVQANEPDAPCLVCFTDCYTSYPTRPSDQPCLWAVVGNKSARPPFGQVIHVEV